MKKLLFCTLILGLCALNANADSSPTVDKFVPSTSVKVKTSPLADMMENATKNATSKSQQKQSSAQKKTPSAQQPYTQQPFNPQPKQDYRNTTSGWS